MSKVVLKKFCKQVLQRSFTNKKGCCLILGLSKNLKLVLKDFYNHLNAVVYYIFAFTYLRYKDYSNGDEDKDHPSWVNIPMLVFIMFNIGPYGMAMHYQYKQLNPALTTSRNNSTLHQYQQLNNSASLKDSPLSCSAVSFDIFLIN